MVQLDIDQLSVPTWLEGLENTKYRKTQNFLKNHKVHFRGRVGSIEGPRMVLDTMEIWSCVPRVPWNFVCCLVCKNIADTADFCWMMIAPPSCYIVLKIRCVN